MATTLMQELAVELVTLGIDVFVCGVLFKGYHDAKKTASNILSAPLVSLEGDDLAGAVARSESRGRTGVIPYAIVRGRVTPLGASLQSQYVKAEGVIQKVSFVEHSNTMTSRGYWNTGERELHSFTNAVPFGVADSTAASEPGTLVEITDWHKSSRLDLDVVFDKFDDSNVNVGSNLIGWLSGNIQRGLLTTERMLCTDTMLTAIGELRLGRDGSVIMVPPRRKEYFLVKSTPQSLAQDIGEDANFIKIMLSIFAGMGALLAFRIAWLAYSKKRQEANAVANAEVLATILNDRTRRQAAENDEEVKSENACEVCMENPIEVRLVECGHEVLCADCALKIVHHNPKCPMCRTEIVTVAPCDAGTINREEAYS